MAGPPQRTCITCARQLAPGELYYRMTVVLQGEQDVLGAPGTGTDDELSTLLQQLQEGPEDARELEAQVHWEHSGVICAACRALVMRTLAGPPDEAGFH